MFSFLRPHSHCSSIWNQINIEQCLVHGNHKNRQVSLLKPLSNQTMAENRETVSSYPSGWKKLTTHANWPCGSWHTRRKWPVSSAPFWELFLSLIPPEAAGLKWSFYQDQRRPNQLHSFLSFPFTSLRGGMGWGGSRVGGFASPLRPGSEPSHMLS